MLSNTAIPRYYKEFRESVINGEIPVCETISLEMNRIDRLIRSPNYYYDESKVEGWIRFCNEELVLTDGSPFHMLQSFKLWGEQLRGWYYFVDRSVYQPNKNGRGGHYVRKRIKKRLTNKQYIIVARGASKTMYGHCNHSYELTVDRSSTYQIATGPTMRQGEEIIGPFQTAILKSRGPYFKFLTEGSLQNTTGARANRPKLYSGKEGIYNTLTNSVLKVHPMTIDKLQGYRNKYNTVDEWLSGDIREDVIGALEQGASKMDNYWIIAISSEGTVRNSVGDTVKMELMDILKGKYLAPNISIWWYRLDDIEEINHPDLWIKANPNIGKTISFEAYQEAVERAENVPSARNDILAKRFGIPMEGYTYFFTYEETLIHRKRSYWQMPCSLGIDLSQGDDFCAFTFLFPLPNGDFGIKVRSYITERTLMLLQPAMRLKYEEFIQEGTLHVMEGTVLDMMEIYEDVERFIDENEYDVRTVGYDPYNAESFITRWKRENGEYGVSKVIQGSKTESVPLGELKKMATDRALLFDEKLMMFAMGNCIVLEDTNGNRKLYKLRHDAKIDNASAMMDAYVAFKREPDAFE